jgi:hypothetical protein
MVALIVLGWLGLMAYVWVWTRSDWGTGWALVGTVNITVAAMRALGIVWLLKLALGHFTNPS